MEGRKGDSGEGREGEQADTEPQRPGAEKGTGTERSHGSRKRGREIWKETKREGSSAAKPPAEQGRPTRFSTIGQPSPLPSHTAGEDQSWVWACLCSPFSAAPQASLATSVPGADPVVPSQPSPLLSPRTSTPPAPAPDSQPQGVSYSHPVKSPLHPLLPPPPQPGMSRLPALARAGSATWKATSSFSPNQNSTIPLNAVSPGNPP